MGLFILLRYSALYFESTVDGIVKRDNSNESSEQYCPVVIALSLYKVTPETVDHSDLWCDPFK